MSWLGIGKEIANPVEAIGNAFDKIFTSDEEKAQGEAVLQKIAMKPHILQAEINKIEAQHRSVFVAGWRPAVGWVCAIGIGWHYIGYPLLSFSLAFIWPDRHIPPLIESEELFSLVVALLGMGSLRSFDKSKGTSK